MAYKKNDRLEIDWLDVVDENSWMDSNMHTHTPPEAYCRSIGYFYKESDIGIWISPSINHLKQDGQRSEVFIPKGMIQKIKRLRLKKE